jgi:hypothetical protein
MNETWTPHDRNERDVDGDDGCPRGERDHPVAGASTVDRAVTLARTVPLLFVMKKEKAQWRISAVRVPTARPPALARII